MTAEANAPESAELFVYYRVRALDTTAALAAVHAMQRKLEAAWPGLQARVLKRRSDAEGPQTWMEVYKVEAGVTADEPFERSRAEELAALVERHADVLMLWIDGERTVETFVPIESGADGARVDPEH
jgi:hypothetical protein